MSAKAPSLSSTKDKLLKASSLSTLMGWAALGQEYAGSNDIHSPSGFDYVNVAQVLSTLLEDACGEIEDLQRLQGEKSV